MGTNALEMATAVGSATYERLEISDSLCFSTADRSDFARVVKLPTWLLLFDSRVFRDVVSNSGLSSSNL